MPAIGGINQTTNSALWQLVQSYLAAERAPLTRLEASRTDLTTRASGFQDLKGRLQALAGAVAGFRWAGAQNPLQQFAATASQPLALSATASASAEPAAHTITIDAVARAHSLAGGEFGSADPFAASGTFTFTIRQGGETRSIAVDLAAGLAAGAALGAIAAAVNAAGAGVRATVVTSDAAAGRQRLLLTSRETGTPALIEEIADVEGGLADLVGLSGSSAPGSFSANTVQEAADALFTFDGLALTSPGNTVTDILPGVTLQLLRAGDGPVALTIARDAAAVEASLGTFIDAYNALVDFVREKTRGADADGEGRGLFTGNATLMALRRELRGLASDPVAGSGGTGELRRLAEIGITADGSGKLSLSDSGALAEALRARPEEVARLFRDETDGVAVRIAERLKRYTQGDGLIARETETLASRRRTLERSIARLTERLARREQTLLQELQSLQSMIQSLLAQQSTLNQLGG